MANNKKKRLPIEHLSDEQLDDLLKYSQPFTEENLNNIHHRFEQGTIYDEKQPKKPQKIRNKLVLLAASVTLLATVGFSQKDNLTKAYYQLFGPEAEKVLSNSEKLTESVEDQGLRLQALATFRDGNTTYFLSELTDLTDNRLDDETVIDNWQMNGGGNSRVIDYDEKTKTATILTTAIDSFDGESATPGYVLKTFFSGEKNEEEVKEFDLAAGLNQSPTWIDLSKQSGQGSGTDDEQLAKYGLQWKELNKTGLAPMELDNILSEKQQVTLSNLAYKDNFLHVQIKSPNTLERFFTFFTLIDKKTEQEVQPMLSYQVDEGTHNNDTGRTDYEEMIFDIPKNQLNNYKIKIISRNYDTIQNGFWAIKLKEPQSLPTIAFKDQTVTIGDKSATLNNIHLSPLSFNCGYEGDILENESLEIKVQMKDGKMINYDQGTAIGKENNGQEFDIQIASEYIDIENVEAVFVNETKLTLE